MLCGLLRLRPLLPRRLLRDLVPPFVHALGLPGPLVLWRICEQRTRPQSCALADVSRRLQERTNTTCDGLPAYQQQRGGLALYQIAHHGGSVWYVGEGERLGDCDTRFRYMWSDMASSRQVPDHQSYSGWKRCAPQTCLSHMTSGHPLINFQATGAGTSHSVSGQCLSFESVAIAVAP